MNYVLVALVCLAALVLLGAALGVRVVQQYERGVVFRFGRVRPQPAGAGPGAAGPDRWTGCRRSTCRSSRCRCPPRTASPATTSRSGSTRSSTSGWSTPSGRRSTSQDYLSAIGQVAQTSLRSIIGKSDLDDLLSDREQLNQGMELMIDSPAAGWGVHIERVEIKDVALPESMKRSMSRQAEAERERRARVITADGELQASEKLAQAAEVMAEHPAALQLRLLQTVVEVAAEKNSTLVLPFPVELLRFLERATPEQPARPGARGPEAVPDRSA